MNAETQQCEHVNMRRVLLVAGMAALLAALVLAQPWHTHIDIGNLYDYPFLRNFYGAEYSEEHQTTFRWTRPQADLLLPGAGRVAPLTMRVHGDYPDMPLRLDDGTGTIALNLRHGWQRVSLLPRPHPWSGDVVLHINAPPQQSDSDGNVSPTPGSAGGSPAPARGLAPPTPYLITQTTFTNRVQSATDPRDRGVVLDWITINGLSGNTPPPTASLTHWYQRRIMHAARATSQPPTVGGCTGGYNVHACAGGNLVPQRWCMAVDVDQFHCPPDDGPAAGRGACV